MGFWRDVFDFSDAADTPARAKAAMQFGAVLLVLGAAGFVVYGIATDWQGAYLGALLVLPVMSGVSLVLNGRLALNRARARRRRGPQDR